MTIPVTGANLPVRESLAVAPAGPGAAPAGPAADDGRTGRSGLDDVCAVLWPPPATVRAARSRAARADEREFIVLPGARHPRLLVPSGRRASAAAVRRYGEPGSARAWAGSRALALALACGAGAAGLGGRLRVQVPEGTGTIEAHLSAVLGRDISISTHLGAARANRKPVLQLLTARGETAGFAKISINPLTRELIRAERAALDTLGCENFSRLSIPQVLHYGSWQDHEVLILSALPAWRSRRKLPPGQLAAAMAEVAAVGGRSHGPLAESGYLARLRSRLSAAPASTDRAALDAALGTVTAAAGNTSLTFGAWHGDWTGWNMANTSGGLLVWDWERFTTDVPAGFDLLHYRLQSAVVRRGEPPRAAAASCASAAADTLAPLGVPADEARLTAILYLADLSARYLADRQAEAGARLGSPSRWLIPAIEEAVTRL